MQDLQAKLLSSIRTGELLKISLVYPRWNWFEYNGLAEPIGLLQLVSALRNEGHDARRMLAQWEPDPVRYAITGLYVDQLQRLWVATGRGEGCA